MQDKLPGFDSLKDTGCMIYFCFVSNRHAESGVVLPVVPSFRSPVFDFLKTLSPLCLCRFSSDFLPKPDDNRKVLQARESDHSGQRLNIDGLCPGFAKGFGTFIDRGSRGEDVIHDQQGFPFNDGGGCDGKASPKIL